MAGHGTKLDRVIERKNENKLEKWTDVVKKRTKVKRPTVTGQPERSAPVMRLTRSLLKVVVVKRGELSFADSVKNMRSKVDANVVGDSISKIRQTRNEDVLIEILGCSEMAENIRREVQKSLGPGEAVKFLEPRSLVQLRDLDCVTTKDDIVDAINWEIGTSNENVKRLSIRSKYGGEQSAMVLIPREGTVKLISKGWIRVRLVYS